MLLYGCFNIDISGPLTQYLKSFPKFSRAAELQPLRASRTLGFPQMRRFCVSSFNANEAERGGSRRRVGVWPWAACGHGTMRSAYSGWFKMAKHTTINPFLLNVMVHVLQGVKAKVPFPNSFWTRPEITPTMSLVVETPETRVGRVMRQNTNSRTVIQITKKCTTLALQCVCSQTHTHTHVAHTRL